jgi:hypothetical protein
VQDLADAVELPVELAGGGGVCESDPAWPKAAGLLFERLPGGVSGERVSAEAAAEVRDDVEATDADRPGRAEDGDAPGGGRGVETADHARDIPISLESRLRSQHPSEAAGIVVGPGAKPQETTARW